MERSLGIGRLSRPQWPAVRRPDMNLALIVTIVAGLVTNPANAYSVIGSGIGSCGSWTTNRRAQISYPAVQEMQWVLGYLSGIGFVGQGGADPLNGAAASGVWAWSDRYCQNHPFDHIEDAAKAVYRVRPH
jgi:hypothetical protein